MGGGRAWWAGLLALLLMLLPLATHAFAPMVLSPGQPGIPLDGHSRYWIDTAPPGHHRDVQTVEASADQLPWSLRTPGFQYALDQKVLWLVFDIIRPSSGDEHWFLEIAASGVDRAVLYHRDAEGRWVSQEAGDSRRVADWPLPGRYPTFELAPQTGQPVRHWLRIEHTRVKFAAPIGLYRQSELLASRDREQFLLGAYAGLSLLIMMVTLAHALSYRDPLFARYAFYVLILSMGQLAYLGVGAQYLWPDALRWNAVATFVLPGLSSAVGLWFVRGVTEPHRFSLGLDSLVLALIALQILMVMLDALAGTPQTFSAMISLILLSLVVICLLIARVWRRGDDRHIRLIALGFLPVVLTALLPLARGLHLIPASALTRYGLAIGSALEMPLLFYALSRRSDHRREAAVRTRALSETDPLTGLTHQRILTMRLDNALARARQQGTRCALLGVNLTNHGQIAGTQGREAADRALVLAAARLRQVISDVDVVSRTGEHQFALLLDGPLSADRAAACATHVVAQGLRDLHVLPGGETLKFRVVVAMLPEGVLNTSDILAWVNEAALSQPVQARKAIVMLNA